jgi:hypothetical protein
MIVRMILVAKHTLNICISAMTTKSWLVASAVEDIIQRIRIAGVSIASFVEQTENGQDTDFVGLESQHLVGKVQDNWSQRP